MKTSFIRSTGLTSLVVFALGVGVGMRANAQEQANKLRIGVYDSRAVAVAYGNSTEFSEAMKQIQADHKKAKADKDEKKLKEIEERMKAQQQRQHEQAFSTGSVAAIMTKIKSSLPAVAKEAEVQLIVSKWELNHQSAEVEVVDVTDKLVALFHVSERGLKWCKEIQNTKPLTIEQAAEHKH